MTEQYTWNLYRKFIKKPFSNSDIGSFYEIHHISFQDDSAEALLPRVYEQTQLLNILTKIKASAICKVIDDI